VIVVKHFRLSPTFTGAAGNVFAIFEPGLGARFKNF
jgi:hypothetical protein